jgi:23S rRNA (adenine2503-C2)-methyltransferase
MTRQIGEKINLLALTKEELQAEVVRMGEPKFRAKQLWDWIHVKGVVCFPT